MKTITLRVEDYDHIATLEAQVDGARQDAAQWSQEYAEQKARAEAAEAKNAKLREALEYYAKHYDWPADGPWGATSTDFGDKARAALSEHDPKKLQRGERG